MIDGPAVIVAVVPPPFPFGTNAHRNMTILPAWMTLVMVMAHSSVWPRMSRHRLVHSYDAMTPQRRLRRIDRVWISSWWCVRAKIDDV